jgi:hypothetical protein
VSGRYNFDDVPGPTVTISFRVPETASLILDEILRDPEVDVEKRTQAMQDAFVKWIMLEEWAKAQRHPEPVDVRGA